MPSVAPAGLLSGSHIKMVVVYIYISNINETSLYASVILLWNMEIMVVPDQSLTITNDLRGPWC